MTEVAEDGIIVLAVTVLVKTRNSMTLLCRILIAAVLSVHMMVGCCWHHAHGCEDKLCSSSSHGHATPDDQCPDNGSDSSHHGQKDCQGEKCTFVSQARTVSVSFVPFCHTFFAALSDDRPLAAGVGPEQVSFASGRSLLPVRLHLANQVMLI